MTTTNVTLETRINYAIARTREAATVKDWHITNKNLRAMRELARELIAGKGYIIATPTEINELYGTDFKDSDEKGLWGVEVCRPFIGTRRIDIRIIPC